MPARQLFICALLLVACVGCGRNQPQSTEPASQAPPQAISSTPPQQGFMYTVQRGDTLMALARKYYGDQKLWKVIRDADSESFKDKPTLDVGQQLWIPPKPEGVSP